MKKLNLLIFALIICSGLMAQNHETLFSNARVIGAFGGPIIEIGDYGGETGTAIGGGGGLIIDNFFLGGYGLGGTDLTSQIFDSNGEDFTLDIGHGGLWLGFTYKQHKLIHVFSSVKLGWGGVGIEFDNGPNYDDGIFVVTPEAGLELNIFRFFKIGATAGYRYVDGIRAGGSISEDHFNGMVGTLTFRFGGFGNWRDW